MSSILPWIALREFLKSLSVARHNFTLYSEPGSLTRYFF